MSYEKENLIAALRDKSTNIDNKKSPLFANYKQYLNSKLPEELLKNHPKGGGARVIRDRFGIPHIFAENEKDLWFACGYAQAQDRLWQLDYRHRSVTGKLAEVTGEDNLHSDNQSRTIGFERAAKLELKTLDDRSASSIDSYTRGVNAWIDTAIDKLPVEFDVLDYEPLAWSSTATLAVMREFWWSLTGRLQQIVGPERVIRHTSPELAAKFLQPEAAEYIVPDQSCPAELHPEGGGDDGTGSNNWIVGAPKSTTGLPLLASDPHWPIHFPDLWYEQHLVGPEIDCIGAAYAGAPPVIFGRTRHATWARTNNSSSTRDLYHEQVDPNNPSKYIDGIQSVPFEIIKEQIAVKGSGLSELKIKLTTRGPIVNEFIPSVDPDGDSPISLKWIGHERIDDMKSLFGLNHAQSADEIKGILSTWRLSVWNAIYADDNGNYGYQMSGNIPKRERKTRGTRDASALEDQWIGYSDTDALPGLHNPKRGWTGSANNTPAPRSLLGEITGAYADGYRFRRIRQVLSENNTVSPETVKGLQWDNLDPRAVELKSKLIHLLKSAGGTGSLYAAQSLESWNCRFDGTSSAPAIREALWKRLVIDIGNKVLAQPAANLMAESAGGFVRSLLLGKENPADYEINLKSIVNRAANEAITYLKKTFGPDIENWGWTQAHTVKLVHPAAKTQAMKQLFNLGPFSCPGGGGTVNNRRPVETANGFENASGVSYRLFVDMSEPNIAWGATLAGQSGQPGSVNYDDRVMETLNNQYHPLLMDEKDINKEAAHEFFAPKDLQD